MSITRLLDTTTLEHHFWQKEHLFDIIRQSLLIQKRNSLKFGQKGFQKDNWLLFDFFFVFYKKKLYFVREKK